MRTFRGVQIHLYGNRVFRSTTAVVIFSFLMKDPVESGTLVVPDRVKALMKFGKRSWLIPVIGTYKVLRYIDAEWILKDLILPTDYKKEIAALDTVN